MPALHFHLWHELARQFTVDRGDHAWIRLFSRYSLASRWGTADWIYGKKVFDGVVSKLIQACQAIEQRM